MSRVRGLGRAGQVRSVVVVGSLSAPNRLESAHSIALVLTKSLIAVLAGVITVR